MNKYFYAYLMPGDEIFINEETMDDLIYDTRRQAFDELCSLSPNHNPDVLRQIIQADSSFYVEGSEQYEIRDFYRMIYRGILTNLGVLPWVID